MSIKISAQVANIYIRDVFDRNSTLYQKKLDELSSGIKYTSIGENPVAFCQSEALKTEININSSIALSVSFNKNLLSMAEEVLDSHMSSLQNVRDLCTQVANDAYSMLDKSGIAKKIIKSFDEMNYLAESTDFNGLKILDGTCNNLELHTGRGETDVINVGNALQDAHVSQLGLFTVNWSGGTPGVGNIDSIQTSLKNADGPISNVYLYTLNGTNAELITDINDAMNAIVLGNAYYSLSPAETLAADVDFYSATDFLDSCDIAIKEMTTRISSAGAYMNRLDGALESLNDATDNLTERKSVLIDTDTAEASADMVRYQILQKAAISIMVQANQVYGMAFDLLNATR